MKRSILYLFISLLVVSCDEHLRIDANEDPQGYADSQFVGSWKITAVESDVPWDYDNNGTSETNIFLTWSNCQKDNLYSFVGDKTGTFKFDCNNTKIGSWEIAQTKYLNYRPVGASAESEKVIQMTSVQFKTTIALTLSNGQPATITKTWDRQ
jgi:hypothetical protein